MRIALFFIIGFLPVFLKAQEIDTLLVKVYSDKITGSQTISDRGTLLKNDRGKDAILIHSVKFDSGRTIAISITDVSGLISCVDKGDKINILFTNGSKMELSSQGEFNCESQGTLYFRGTFGGAGRLDDLKEKTISAIRLWGMNNYSDANFDKEQAQNFMTALQIIDAYKFK